ncbi:CARDB domain-containing protein [Candidatus Omnitrophota bacterium]
MPPKAVTIITIEQIEKLDPIYGRADLAINAREIELVGDTVSGTLHNIGSSNAEGIVVALIDGEGNVIAQKTIDAIDAPLDLVPRRKNFSIPLQGKPQSAVKLVVDPDNNVPEIYEGNNTVEFDELPAADYSKGFE